VLVNRNIDCVVVDGDSFADGEVAALLDATSTDGAGVALVIVVRGEVTPELTKLAQLHGEARPTRVVTTHQELFDATALFLHRPVLSRMPVTPGVAASSSRLDPLLEGRKVLIVDDDPRNVFAISSVLEGLRMDVSFAENGRDGIEVLSADPGIDLVLMDIMMPGMDGYATMEAIRKLDAFADLPIIALTAKAMVGDREKAIAAGASDYVTKPVDIDVLVAALRRWMAP